MATTLGRASAAMSETSMPERVPEREVLATVVTALPAEVPPEVLSPCSS